MNFIELSNFFLPGKADERGFGSTNEPRYSYISDVKALNEEFIAVVDVLNFCVRKVSRKTGSSEAFAGRCGQNGTFNGTVPATEANFTSPVRALHIKEQNILYYLLYPEARIVRHNLTSGNSIYEQSIFSPLQYRCRRRHENIIALTCTCTR